MLSPVVDQVAEEVENVSFGKVNVDDEQELAINYGVMSIPTLIFFKNGNPVKEVVGFHSKSELEEIINEI